MSKVSAFVQIWENLRTFIPQSVCFLSFLHIFPSTFWPFGCNYFGPTSFLVFCLAQWSFSAPPALGRRALEVSRSAFSPPSPLALQRWMMARLGWGEMGKAIGSKWRFGNFGNFGVFCLEAFGYKTIAKLSGLFNRAIRFVNNKQAYIYHQTFERLGNSKGLLLKVMLEISLAVLKGRLYRVGMGWTGPTSVEWSREMFQSSPWEWWAYWVFMMSSFHTFATG